ncbi:MAG: asparagine synthase-related protein, partial [Gemmatimonadota bacterium]
RTASDTEVLVEAYRAWGHEVWSRLNGFWAVALLDLRDGALVLSRDRPGIAPLYCREGDGRLLFSSLQRPLLDPGRPRVARARTRAFVDTGLKDFDRRTFFREIRSLPPATTVVLPPGCTRVDEGRRIDYWRAPSAPLGAHELGLDEAADRLRETLADAVRLRLRADRPVALELSGGLDSSSLVALAARESDAPVTTWTLRVPERDEEPFARTLRDRYDLDFRVLDGVEETFADEAHDFAALMEEPYHAASIYTHYRMRRRMKRAGSDVVLTGSGGDEVLAGYEWDFWPAARRALEADGARLQALRFHLAQRYGTGPRARESLEGWARWAGRSLRHPLQLARRVAARLARPAPSRPPSGAGDAPWPTGGTGDGPDPAYALHASYPGLDYAAQRRYHLEVAQLPYYLRSNDHFTFDLPLEHRFPFLDHRVIELGLTMPPRHLFRDGWTKYVLRRAMEGLLPPEVLWRREKMGFPFPFRRFLRQNRPAFEPLLRRVADAGLAEPADYGALLASDHHRLWRVCSTGLWLESGLAPRP